MARRCCASRHACPSGARALRSTFATAAINRLSGACWPGQVAKPLPRPGSSKQPRGNMPPMRTRGVISAEFCSLDRHHPANPEEIVNFLRNRSISKYISPGRVTMTEQLAAGADGQIQYATSRANAEVPGKNPMQACAVAGRAISVRLPAAARCEARRQSVRGGPRRGEEV